MIPKASNPLKLEKMTRFTGLLARKAVNLLALLRILKTQPVIFGLVCGFLISYFTSFQSLEYTVENFQQDLQLSPQISNKIFEPLETNKQTGSGKDGGFTRSKFIRDEIFIRKRVMASIVIGKGTENEFLVAHNKTLKDYVDSVLYFSTETRLQKLQSAENVIQLPTVDLFSVTQYLADKHNDEYSYHWLVDSKTLLNGRQLQRVLDKLQFEEKLFLGQGNRDGHCNLYSGIILSNDILSDFRTRGNECERSSGLFGSASPASLYGQCLNTISKARCENVRRGVEYQSRKMEFLEASAQDSRNLLVISNLPDKQALEAASRHLYTMEIANIEAESNEITRKLKEFSQSSGTDWPDDLVFRPRFTVTRFDRNLHTRFNSTHFIGKDSFELSTKISEDDSVTFTKMADECSKSAGTRLSLVSGWSKMEPSAGISYSLLLEDADNAQHLRTDCAVYQQLAEPRTISLPFVTEATKISLLLPVHVDNVKSVPIFLKHFDRVCLERGDKVLLMLVFLYPPDRPDKNNNKDFYKEIKQAALLLSKKYKKKENTSHILWYSMQLKSSGMLPSTVEMLDLVLVKLDSSIVLLGSAEMELHPDYLNRVRMNTVLNKLVFSPLPFTQFHPKLVFGSNSPHVATMVKMDFSSGHFDKLDYNHISFYKEDYWAARSILNIPVITKENEIHSINQSSSLPEGAFNVVRMFADFAAHNTRGIGQEENGAKIHMLRAPEPSLRLRYKRITCGQYLPPVAKEDCEKQAQRSLGSRIMLGKVALADNTEETAGESDTFQH